jgi:5'-methylthioadenosine phosphorylase
MMLSEVVAIVQDSSASIAHVRISYPLNICQEDFMEPGNIAIVGGTGFEQLPPEIFAEPVDVVTAHGVTSLLAISDNYTEPYHLYFLSRHGSDHGLAPHQINYRSNILALRDLGVRYVFATNAVGSLRDDLMPGSLVVLDDFIDFTKQRPTTYFEDRQWSHTDFSEPYSRRLRNLLLQEASGMTTRVHDRGTYVCCDGPRFESPAEVRLFRNWGGDVVGMTGLPEAVFAREAGMEYAALAVVTNFGAGLTDMPVDHMNVVKNMAAALPLLREITLAAAGRLVRLWTSG